MELAVVNVVKAGNGGIIPLLVPDSRHLNSHTVAESLQLEISKSGHWKSLNLGTKAEIYDKIHVFMRGAITP